MAKSPLDFGVEADKWDANTETLSQAIGFFLVCFGRLELTITLTLAILLDYNNDYERFGILANGLDASGKIARLRSAAKLYNKPIGANLSALLEIFVKRDCRIRNSVCHSWPLLDDKEVVHFGNLSALPKHMGRGPARPLGRDPSHYPIKHIYERALWMLKLNSELIRVIRLRPVVSLEVDPKNLSPPPEHQAHAKAIGATKIDRRAPKAQRTRPKK